MPASFPGFDEKIASVQARGMSAREIAGHLPDFDGFEVSPGLFSTVTDAVLQQIATRPVARAACV